MRRAGFPGLEEDGTMQEEPIRITARDLNKSHGGPPPVPPPVDRRPPVPPPITGLLGDWERTHERRSSTFVRRFALLAGILILVGGAFFGGMLLNPSFAPSQLAVAKPSNPWPAVEAPLAAATQTSDLAANQPIQPIDQDLIDEQTAVVESVGPEQTPAPLVVQPVESSDAVTESAEPLPATDDSIAETSLPEPAIENASEQDQLAKVDDVPLAAKVAQPEPAEALKPAAERPGELELATLDEPEVCDTSQMHGTQLVWAESVNRAAVLANEQEKLVYLIHVSGNFEIPEFT